MVVMYKLIGIVILTAYCVAEGDLLCKENNPCNCQTDVGLIDIWSLGNTDSTFRFIVFDPDENVTIAYNPCYTATVKQVPDLEGEGCTDVAACITMHNETDEGKLFQMRMGLQSETNFIGTKTAKGSSFSINYDGVIDDETERNRSLKVDLICDVKATVPQIVLESISGLDSNDSENIQVTLKLTSICACLDKCPRSGPSHHKKGLSTGSILIILFFVAVLMYILGGILYNYIVTGASGIELLPNVEFWTAFPLLVIDGVRFTCNCCRAKRFGSAYDNM